MNRMFTFRVKANDRQDRGGSLAIITAGQLICIPALMVGGMLGEGLSPGGILFCVIIGGLILLGCTCFMGAKSCRSGLPSTIISAEGLGLLGGRYISALLISITSIGWFGVQAAVCGTSFSVMTAETLGFSIPVWSTVLFWGIVMTVPAMYGYRVLKFLYHIIVPVLFVVLVCMLIYLLFFSKTGFTSIFAWRPERPISYLTGITLVVGAWAMGAFTVGDYCRYGKSLRGTALGIFIGLIIVVPVVFMGGALFFILMGQADITVILNGLGFPAVALIFLILGAWNLNMVNAYSGGIVLSVLLNFPEKRLKFCTALTGILGTVLGVAGILSWFTGFLSLLSSLVPPVIGALMGVKMADMLKRRKNGQMKGVRIKPGFHIPGVIAYGCGAFTAWLTTGIVPFFIPPLDGIITAAAVYVMLDIILGRKKG